MKMLEKRFYTRDARTVARALVGKVLVCNAVSILITETEAYLPDDSACHAFRGKTKRNAPMFLEGGVAYVYLCYGLFNLFNVVVDQEDVPAAVLVRAALGFSNPTLIRERRNGKDDLVGPGKIGQAIGAGRALSGQPLFDPEFCIIEGLEPMSIETAPRVGIDYAQPRHRDAHLRFIARGFHPPPQLT